MEKYVLTIARQFGSMGRPIAKEVSELLNIPYYDRDIVDSTAKRLNLPISTISDQEEKARGSLSVMKFPLGNSAIDMQNKIFEVQKNIIFETASKESCIIVGRCSDYICKNINNHIAIYIYAPYEKRLENCINQLGIDKESAPDMIASVDKARELYHKKYAGFLPSDPDYKNFMIDSSLLGISGTAKLIANMVLERFS